MSETTERFQPQRRSRSLATALSNSGCVVSKTSVSHRVSNQDMLHPLPPPRSGHACEPMAARAKCLRVSPVLLQIVWGEVQVDEELTAADHCQMFKSACFDSIFLAPNLQARPTAYCVSFALRSKPAFLCIWHKHRK